jgi:hypothetical protein
LPTVDDGNLVADLLHLVEEVGGQEHRSTLRDEAADHVAELVNAGGIEPVGRLIQDQELRVCEQAARNTEPLAHPQRVALHAFVCAVRKQRLRGSVSR